MPGYAGVPACFASSPAGFRGGDEAQTQALHGAVDMLLNMRLEAKRNKDWGTSDKIRNELTALGFSIKDTKDGFEWTL